MSRFLNHASEIFETASAAPNGDSSSLTILIHPKGQIHIVDGVDSPLDSLQTRYGCSSAFQVTRNGGLLRVEGRDGSSSCLLEDRKASKSKSSQIPAGLFWDRPLYSVAGTLSLS